LLWPSSVVCQTAFLHFVDLPNRVNYDAVCQAYHTVQAGALGDHLCARRPDRYLPSPVQAVAEEPLAYSVWPQRYRPPDVCSQSSASWLLLMARHMS
jgi:hypothetical protein